MNNKQQLNFVIARERPDGGLASYSFGGEVKFDTLKAAKEYCRYANERCTLTKDQFGNSYSDYNIYGLVKIDL